jgi:hypothetical protein
MEQLHVGDSVLTSAGYSNVFAFMIHQSGTQADYVQIETQLGLNLSLTAEHIVFAHADRRPVLAQSILEQDVVWILTEPHAELVPSRVIRVARTTDRGLHAPLTEQGTVIVNGILASSYAGVKSLQWGQRILLSGHDIGQYIHEPLRFACRLVPSLCSPEWHGVTGRHAWTQFVIEKFGWLKAMNHAHNDILVAISLEASLFSLLAVFAQLVVAVPLFVIFGLNLGHIAISLYAVMLSGKLMPFKRANTDV